MPWTAGFRIISAMTWGFCSWFCIICCISSGLPPSPPSPPGKDGGVVPVVPPAVLVVEELVEPVVPPVVPVEGRGCWVEPAPLLEAQGLGRGVVLVVP